jgi:hypothetical protein
MAVEDDHGKRFAARERAWKDVILPTFEAGSQAPGLEKRPAYDSGMRRALARKPEREALGLTPAEFATLRRLATPEKIQAFLNAIPINHELDGETILSVREVLRQRRAHCIEGALLAACALWVHGEPPLVMHLDCDPCDYPHVIALFRRQGAWGALSKTNGACLRYRDPIYRSLRELAMSYFHEYFDKRGRKTLRSYSGAFDLRRIDLALWVTSTKACLETHDRLEALPHHALISTRQARLLAKRDPFERRAAALVEYPRPAKRPARPHA